MAAPADSPSTSKPRWYVPTPAKFLVAVLLMQGVFFLSPSYHWFWFNERKGYTVLIIVAATAVCLVFLLLAVLIRRFFTAKAQYSLGTLLLMVPVVAIPCGWLAREMQQARQQRDLVEFCLGAVTSPENVSANWLTQTLGADFFRDVVGLQLGNYPRDDSITDVHMKKLAVHTKLRSLYVVGHNVTDAGLEHLKGLTRLERLYLNGTQVTDAGLEHLKGLKQLEWLELNDTQVTDAGLEHLKELKQLRVLRLEGTGITDAGLEHLKGLTKLQFLCLSETQVTDAGLEHLKGLKELERPHLSRPEEFTEILIERSDASDPLSP